MPEMKRIKNTLETPRVGGLPRLKTEDFHNAGPEEPLTDSSDTASAVFERIIDESDLLPIYFLEQGARVQRSVARVVLTKAHDGLPAGSGWATGFLVSPTLFLTNNHVIPDEAFAAKIRMQFNFQLGPDGLEQETESFFPAPDDVFRTNPDLDYTLIRLRPNQVNPATGTSFVTPGERWGFLPLNQNPTFRLDQSFNIIQHPSGRRKEVAIQNNEVEKLFQNAVRYTTDTEPGSSGSPVFDNLWELVALHHAGGDFDNASGKWLNNEGIRVDRIIDDLREAFGANRQEVLEELGI
ncbi:MAG: trypsin-like serine peptidase [Vicinamibacteria bacterium]